MPNGSVGDQKRVRAAARALREQLGRDQLEPYEPYAWSEDLLSHPVLHLDDVSAIPFLVDIGGVEEYQHRARLRAGAGDLVAAGTPQNAPYETYCREFLRLGQSDFVLAADAGNPLEVAQACTRGRRLAKIVARAQAAGGLVIHPYMGIEAVWELARAVAEASQRDVGVLAPPPPVTWVANDKAAFADVVARILGTDYLVETLRGSTPRELASHLTRLAARHEQVALKRLRCASAMGNAVFDSEALHRLEPEALAGEVEAFLERTEWDGREEVLAVAWEDTDLSPSTQMWIPPDATGAPVLDGIYEQILSGKRRVFVGSRPSTLPEAVNSELETASLAIAAGLQQLGYVGRCSFDFLVVGDVDGEFAVRFVECNGRWGGTSTPMALLDRLVAQGPARAAPGSRRDRRPPYRAQDFVHPELAGANFGELLEAVGDALFDPVRGRGRFVFYNVGPLERFGKLDVIALGENQEQAEAALEIELPRLLGLS